MLTVSALSGTQFTDLSQGADSRDSDTLIVTGFQGGHQ